MGITDVAGWPTYLVLTVFAVIALVVMFGARYILHRTTDGEHRAQVADLAGSMNGPTGATLAFLVGFAVTITWTTMSSAQTSVERLAAQAQQTALLAGSVLEPADSKRFSSDLRAYLNTIADQDSVVLGGGVQTEMPSFTPLLALQGDVRELERTSKDSDTAAQVRTLQSDIVQLAETQAELNAVARRGLPSVVLQLLMLTGCLSAATVGMLAVNIHRPYLIAGWALVIAMGLTVVFALYDPFSGSVSITFDPLSDAARRIIDR